MYFAELWAEDPSGPATQGRTFENSRGSRPANPTELARIIDRLNNAAEKIERRGGEVIFVALPACGGRADFEEELFPRAKYWDRFVASTSHRTIYAGDVPSYLEAELL